MGEKLKENWPVIVFTAIISSLISVGVASAAVKWGKIDDAVSEAEFIEFKTDEEKRNKEILFENKKYVDDSFNNHEAKEQLVFENVKLMIGETKIQNEEILKGLNRVIELSEERITRLENKVY